MNRVLRLASVLTATAALTAGATGYAAAAYAGVPVHRVAGPDRIATAVAASKLVWSDAGDDSGDPASAVVLSRYDQYADALGGSALAGAAGGPLLLTRPGAVDSATLTEIRRLLDGTGTVYLLGGTGAISAGVEQRLQDEGYSVRRLSGPDRYATSVKVSKEVAALGGARHPQFIFATTGRNFPDGLAAGATAGGYGASVVLTKDGVLPTAVKSYLDAERTAGTDIYAIGGASAGAAFPWTMSIVGRDRYETAADIAHLFWGDPDSPDDDPTWVALATGENWPDALAGGALVAAVGPLMLTRATSLPATTKDTTKALVESATPPTVEVGAVLGGKSVVSDKVKAAFTTAINP
ncbi:cell wall-binding repeat-containing protein [Intrasporangium sp.]|uniref:cell wall-binding repeat-containing protein n=1 Tax=Intrasporangium sp. TaxID=1925024 RepID=UPI0032214972